jgi:SOS-response transcriptional repressor LexA
MTLPPRQEELLRFVHDYATKNGRGPSVREIAGAMGANSLNAVGCQLRALRKKGLVTKPEFPSARSTALTDEGKRAIGASCCSCAHCACGCHARADQERQSSVGGTTSRKP